MSFIRPQDMFFEKPILGGCMCVESLSPIHPRYYGHGIGDILDKVMSTSSAQSISKVVSAIPQIYQTIKSITQTNPQVLNDNLQKALESNPSTITDVIKSINKKGTGMKRRKMLDNHSQMILESILAKHHGSGIETI